MEDKNKQHLDPQATIASLIHANGHRIRLPDLASNLADLIPVGQTFGTFFNCENLSSYLAHNDFFYVNNFAPPGQPPKISDTFVYINNPPAGQGEVSEPSGPGLSADATANGPGPRIAETRREAIAIEVLRRSANRTSNLPKVGTALHQARLSTPGLKAWLALRPELFQLLPGDHVTLQPLNVAPGFDNPAAEAALQLALAGHMAKNPGRMHMGSGVGAFLHEIGVPVVRGALGQFLKVRDTVFRSSADRDYAELHAKPGVPAAGAYSTATHQANELAEYGAQPPRAAPPAAAGLPNGAQAANGPAHSRGPAGTVRGQVEWLREELVTTRQEAVAARTETAELRALCGRLEAEVAYLYEALAGVCGSLRLKLPARPPALGPLPAAASREERADAGGGEGAGGSAPRLFIVGGHDSANWLDSVDVFRPGGDGGGGWSTLAPQGYPRSFAAAAMLGSNLYVVGGGNGEVWFDSVLRFDVATEGGEWVPVASMSSERGSLGVAAINGQIIACGGGIPGAQHDLVEMYDATTDRWLAAAPMTSRRFALGAATLDSCVYAVGGFDGDFYMSSAERFDPRVGKWEKLPADMAEKRGSHACCASDGLLYAVGGFDGESSVPTVEVYDARAGRWRYVDAMSAGRAYGGAVALGGRLYALGGLKTDMTSYAPLVEEYQPAANAWKVVDVPAHLNQDRGFFACAAWEP
ncbi:hypothetical protein WJX81_007519 [Elliptochloris bilobata]|uniref:DCD domain-containing protein n=1 Tax=Elliptochloris bilobata TaxID=381761 RepID=A0AAW1SKC8_9CHLO